MDDILLSDSNLKTLERMFEKENKILPRWGLQIPPEKMQRGNFVSYLGYKIGLHKMRTKKGTN